VINVVIKYKKIIYVIRSENSRNLEDSNTDNYLIMEEQRIDFIHDFEPAWYATSLSTPIGL